MPHYAHNNSTLWPPAKSYSGVYNLPATKRLTTARPPVPCPQNKQDDYIECHSPKNVRSLFSVSKMKDLQYFSRLNTAKRQGKKAPHKALLLISIIDLIGKGIIEDNHIVLDDNLVRTFNATKDKYYPASKLFRPSIANPFYHLGHEPFYRLAPNTANTAAVASKPATTYGNEDIHCSIKSLREQFSYAEIDEELFSLLKNKDIRAKLTTHLITNYLYDRMDAPISVASIPVLLSAVLTMAG